MKIKGVLFLLITFIMTSCNVNDIEIEEESENLVFEKHKIENINKNALRSRNVKDEALQNRMQWLSYITAHTIINDVNARNQFRNEANNSTPLNIITLENLINNPVNSSFKDAFKDVFLYNYYTTTPCTNGGRPRGRPQPVGVIGGIAPGSDFDTLIFNNYISSLLENNCFEFYLPNGFFFLQSTGISNPTNNPVLSTAHPLNNSDSNYGFKSFNTCSVEDVNIDNSTSGLILVVRPFRSDNNCSYSDYSVINFEDFLSN